MPTQTIDQWEQELKAELYDFVQFWKAQKDSKLFPTTLLKGDWDEHFTSYQEGTY